MTATEPVFVLRDEYQAEDYWPEDYVANATPVLRSLGWVTGSLDERDVAAAVSVLRGLHDIGLDETDVYPFGLLWALRSTGAIAPLSGLDDQLRDWRAWEEGDHLGERMEFLPALPEVSDV